MKRAAGVFTVALTLAGLDAGQAAAADLPPLTAAGEWRFTLAPYAWATGISGDVGLFGRDPITFDVPFSDIIGHLDFAAMGVAEAHNGTWGVLVDVDYVRLGAKDSLSRVISENPPVTAQLKASLGVTEMMATVMGQWRAVDQPDVTLDLMGGARYWNVDTDITLRLKANGVKIHSLSGSESASWIDPMIGAKTRINTQTPVFITGWGLIGGFGAGSDISWDVMGGLGYQWTEQFSTVAGYRALGVDYDNDGFVYDVIQSGVILGAVISF